jgi:hypothetical protein
MTRALAGCALFGALALLTPQAQAQPRGGGDAPKPDGTKANMAAPPATSVPLAQSLSGPAKEAFDAAQLLSNNSDFAGALTKFEQAYALSGDTRLLFNMAVCAKSLRSYVLMRSLLLRYQREAGAALSAEDRSIIDAALAASRGLVGAVKLDVDPAGARVLIDGRVLGTTPLAEPVTLDLGDHALFVQKAGFDPIEQTLHVMGGNEMTLTLRLTAQRPTAQLLVSADPKAAVTVDGQLGSGGRFDGVVAPGPHDVLVTQPGKVTQRTQVQVHAGEALRIDVTLHDERQAAPVWPWVAGGVVLAAGAAVGGYFLFKSSSNQGPEPVTCSFGCVTLSAARGVGR